MISLVLTLPTALKTLATITLSFIAIFFMDGGGNGNNPPPTDPPQPDPWG